MRAARLALKLQRRRLQRWRANSPTTFGAATSASSASLRRPLVALTARAARSAVDDTFGVVCRLAHHGQVTCVQLSHRMDVLATCDTYGSAPLVLLRCCRDILATQ